MATEAEEEAYRNMLLKAISKLGVVYEELFDSMLNIMVKGEWREWDETMEVGDTVRFTLDMFDGSADPNIQLLRQLLIQLRSSSEALVAINEIDEAELEAASEEEEEPED